MPKEPPQEPTTTKPRPEGTKPLFVNAPHDLLEALDAMARDVEEADPMRRRVTRTDLVLKAIRDMIEAHQAASARPKRSRK